MYNLSLKPLILFILTVLISLVASCSDNNNTLNPVSSTPANPTSTASPIPTSLVSSLSPTKTEPVTHPRWEAISNWVPANQIRSMLIDSSGNLWAGGPGGLVYWDLGTGKTTTYVISDNPEKTNVIALSQTPDKVIWIGTFGSGLTRFDGANWQSFTSKNSLPGDYILSQAVSSNGELWLDTKIHKYDSDSGQEFHFGRFDGKKWKDEVGGGFSWIIGLADGSIVGARGDTGIAKHDSIIGIYDGQTWNDLGLTGQTITAIAASPDGVIWVATPENILQYVNQAWKKITPPWIGQTTTHVSTIVIDQSGTAWFGFSYFADDLDRCGSRVDYVKEWGVYRYKDDLWTHFTTDDGLVDNKICEITLDTKGNVWFGSFDKGISRFDGENWKTFVIP